MTTEGTIGRTEENGERLKRHIVIGMMGPVGAGKSTLAKEMGKRWGVEVIEEGYADNPFLERFYENPKEYSFRSQFFFLDDKTSRLARRRSPGLKLFDPALQMDRLYASTHHRLGWMSDEEWDLYQKSYRVLSDTKKVVSVDFFVVVNAERKVLERRIRERGRPYELLMLERFPQYFAELSETVREWTLERGPAKILINADYYNFTAEGREREDVLESIEGAIAVYIANGRSSSTADLIFPPFKPAPHYRDRAIKSVRLGI